MALTADQTAALALLASADVKDVADGLKEHAAPAYQAVYARGFGTAKGEAKIAADSAAAEIVTLTTERDEAKTEAVASGTKDADALAKIERLEAALTFAKSAATDATTRANSRIKALHTSRENAALVAELVKSGVDPDYAEQVLAPKLGARIRVGEPADDGTAAVDYLDADGLAPLQSGRAGLAAEAVKTLDAKWIAASGAAGGGLSGGGTATATAQTTEAAAARLAGAFAL